MAKRRDVPTRNDVRERGEGYEKEMEGKEVNLGQIASDVETVRQTLEKLEGGTSEGTEEVERAIESAEDVTEKEFDREDEELERTQENSQEFEGELQDHRGSSESDTKRITDASGDIKTQETIRELEKAKEAALRDIDFLAERIDRARKAREKSDTVQEKLRSQVHTGRRRQ